MEGVDVLGQFEVKSKRAIHRLFAIAEQNGVDYGLTFTKLETEFDLIDEKDQIEHHYVDQLDIDGDGADEVVIRSTYYKRTDYTIFKFDTVGQVWREVYTEVEKAAEMSGWQGFGQPLFDLGGIAQFALPHDDHGPNCGPERHGGPGGNGAVSPYPQTALEALTATEKGTDPICKGVSLAMMESRLGIVTLIYRQWTTI